MGFATVVGEVSFATNPMSTPTWVDVSSYLREVETSRGRQDGLDRQEAGGSNAVLSNNDRRFDPTYAAGPYYGNIWPMRRFRVRATWGSITYNLFSGFVESWLPSWPKLGADSIINVEAVDGFKYLSLVKLNTSYSQEASDSRINNVLNSASWTTGQTWVLGDSVNSVLGSTTVVGPDGDRLIDGGLTTIQASELSDMAALQHIQDVVESENGNAFINKDGTFVFHNRHRVFRQPYSISQATFTDVAGGLNYADLKAAFDDSRIWNQVRLTRLDGSEQTATDSTSQTKYGPRVMNKTSLLMTTDAEALAAANWLLTKYKDLTDPATDLPMVRFTEISLLPQSDDDLWPQVLGRELGERITIVRNGISQESIIAGIQHRITAEPKFWETTFKVYPADTVGYWILGDSTFSILGSSSRLAY